MKEGFKELKKRMNRVGRTGECKPFADKLEGCVPFTCGEPHPLIPEEKLVRTIEGMKDGRCHYTETMPGEMLLFCAYSEKTTSQKGV